MDDIKQRELLPCPFCGGEAGLWEGDWAATDHGVVCTKCETQVDPCHIKGVFTSEQRAIKAWNTRSLTLREEKLVEALRFYANQENFTTSTPEETAFKEYYLHDEGEEARKALKELGIKE